MTEKLQEYRTRAGLSQAALARQTGIRIKAIQAYEQGYRALDAARADTVIKLAQALGCHAEDLIEIEGKYDEE